MKPDKIDRMHILEETHWHEHPSHEIEGLWGRMSDDNLTCCPD